MKTSPGPRSMLAAGFLAASTFCSPGAEVQRINTPNDGIAPAAQIDDGKLHLVYVLKENLFYVRSEDSGKTFSAPIRVNSEPDSTFAGMFRGPDIAVGRNGRVHVIWYNNGYQRKLPQDQWGVMYSFLDAKGAQFSPAKNLNHKPSDNYSLAANRSGDIAVFWMAEGLFLTSSLDNGETFPNTVRIEGADTCECCGSHAAFLADGGLSCAYRDKAGNLRDMFLAIRPKGESKFELQKISVTPWPINACPMTGTFLGATPAGALMTWQTKGQVYYTRFAEDPVRRKGEVRVPVYDGKYPVARELSDGTVLITWKKGSTVGWQLFDAGNKPLGEAQSRPSKNPHRHAAVVSPEGNFIIID